MGRFLALIALVLSTSCRKHEVVTKDPTPPVDAAPPVEPVKNTLALLHGRIIDVSDGRVVHVLHEKRPRAEAIDVHGAYTLDRDDKLRAWNTRTGKQIWEADDREPGAILLDEKNIYRGGNWGFAIRARSNDWSGVFSAGAVPHTGEFALLGGLLIARQGPNEVAVFDATARKYRGSHRTSTTIESVIEDPLHALAVARDRICFAMFEPPNHRVECIDADAKVVRTASVALARTGDSAGTRFHTRFVSPHHIVIGTWSFGGFKSTRRAAVVRLSDLNVNIVEDEIAAAVEGPDGSLEGLLVAEPEMKLLDPSGAVRWAHKPAVAENFAAVARIDDRLVVAAYNAIATGVQVFALNVKDGKLLWTGETKLPPIAHSKYRNHVTLETLGDAVILRGHESSVDHVHVYDSKTGALRFSDAQ